jgi:hypothetical protein
MTEKHPITPSPELVQQWIGDYYGCPVSGELSGVETVVAARAAQWGSDQELEACCELIDQKGFLPSSLLRLHRRPKPPSLKEQALETLQRLSKDGYPCNYQEDSDWDTIRRALEALPDDINEQS